MLIIGAGGAAQNTLAAGTVSTNGQGPVASRGSIAPEAGAGGAPGAGNGSNWSTLYGGGTGGAGGPGAAIIEYSLAA